MLNKAKVKDSNFVRISNDAFMKLRLLNACFLGQIRIRSQYDHPLIT